LPKTPNNQSNTTTPNGIPNSHKIKPLNIGHPIRSAQLQRRRAFQPLNTTFLVSIARYSFVDAGAVLPVKQKAARNDDISFARTFDYVSVCPLFSPPFTS
jgi:hypothetical protein